MREAALGAVVLVALFAGCTDGEGSQASDPARRTPLDPYPGVNETLFEEHRRVSQAVLAPLALVPVAAIVDGDLTVMLAFDGRHFAVHAEGASDLFVRLYRPSSNETVALLRGTSGGLREVGPFDPAEGLRLEVRDYERTTVPCEAPCEPFVRGTLVAAPPPLDVDVAPRLTVTVEGPAAGTDAMDQLEFGLDGRPAPREEQAYTVVVEASRFLRGRVRFDFDASRIVDVTPVTVAQNYSTAFVPLDGARRLAELSNLTPDDLVVRQTFRFLIDYENGTAHGPAGGTEEQLFRAEALAWTPVAGGRAEALAARELAVSVTMEVP